MTLQQLTIDTLDRIARGDATADTVIALCQGVERLIPGSTAGVCVLDRAAMVFERAYFPSLAPTFQDAIKGARVTDRPGSCAVAIYDGKHINTDDIANDGRFLDGWKALNRDHGVTAISSEPLFGENGVSLGTFVLGFAQPHALSDGERDVTRTAARLCTVALVRERKDRHTELLLGEMHHRTRNTFATIGALVYSTLRTYPEAATFRKVFDARLVALSRAYTTVLNQWGADLGGLLTDLLSPYTVDRQIELNGPKFQLTQSSAVAFSLAAHELATNANKYGSLSQDNGKLAIGWRIDAGAERPYFEMVWTERDGPAVPSRTPRAGFGRNTIEQSLAQTIDGTVTLDFAPTGLICTIRAPLSDRLGAALN